MKKRKKWKRIISIFLSLLMVVSLLPAFTVNAEEPETQEQTEIQIEGEETDGEVPEEVVVEEPEVFLNPVPEEQMGDVDLPDGLYFGADNFDVQGRPLIEETLSTKWRMDAKNTQALYLVVIENGEITPILSSELPNVIFEDYFSGDPIPRGDSGVSGYYLDQAFGYGDDGMPVYPEGLYNFAFDNTGDILVVYGDYSAMLAVVDPQFGLYSAEGGNQADLLWNYANFDGENNVFYIHQNEAFAFDPDEETSYRFVAKEINFSVMEDSMEGRVPSNVVDNGKVSLTPVGDGSDIKVEILDYESDYQFRVVVSYTEEMYVWDDSIGENGDWNYVESSDNKEYEFPFSKNYGWNPDQPEPELEDGLYFGDVDWDDKPYAAQRNLCPDREFGAKTDNTVSLFLAEGGNVSHVPNALENLRVVRRGTNTDATEIDLSYVPYGNPEDNLVEKDVFNIYSAVLGEYTLIYTDDNNNSYSAYFTIALPNTGIYSAPEATLANLINGHEAEFTGSGQVFYLLTADQQSADGGYIRDVVFSKAPEVRIEGRDAGYWDSICSIEPVGTDKKKYKVTILEDFEEIWIEAEAQATEYKKNDAGQYNEEVLDPWYQSYRFYPSELMDGVYVCDREEWQNDVPVIVGRDDEWSRSRDWDAKVDTNFGVKVRIGGEEVELSTLNDFDKFSLVKVGEDTLPEGTEFSTRCYFYWDKQKQQGVEAYKEDMLHIRFVETGVYYLTYSDGENEVKARLNVKLPDFGIYTQPERNIDTLIDRSNVNVDEENNEFYLIAANTYFGDHKSMRHCVYVGEPAISLMGWTEAYWEGVCDIAAYETEDDDLQIYKVTVLDFTREFAVRVKEQESYKDWVEEGGIGHWVGRNDTNTWDTDYRFIPDDSADGLYIGHMDWDNGIPFVQENDHLEKFQNQSAKNSFSFVLYLRRDGEDTLITTDQIDNLKFVKRDNESETAGTISVLGYWDNDEEEEVLTEDIFDGYFSELGIYDLIYTDPDTGETYAASFAAGTPDFGIYTSPEGGIDALVGERNYIYSIGEREYYLVAVDFNNGENKTENIFTKVEVEENCSDLATVEPVGNNGKVYKVTIKDPSFGGIRILTQIQKTNLWREDTENGEIWRSDRPQTEDRDFEFWPSDAQEGFLGSFARDGEAGGFVWQDNPEEYHKMWSISPLKSEIGLSFALVTDDGELVPLGPDDIENMTVTDTEGNVVDENVIKLAAYEYAADSPDNQAENVITLTAYWPGTYFITYSNDGFTDSVLVRMERQDIGLHAADPEGHVETLVFDRTGEFSADVNEFFIYAFEFKNEDGRGIINEITNVRFGNDWVPAAYWENRVSLTEVEAGKCWKVEILGDYHVPFDVEVDYEHTDYWEEDGEQKTNNWHGGEWFNFRPSDGFDGDVYTIDDGELLQGFTACYIPEIVYQYPELMWSEYMGENVTMYYVHGETMEEVIEKLTAVEIGEKLIGVPVAGEDIVDVREATEEDNIVNTGYIEVYANQYGDRAVVSQNIPAVENLNGIIFHTEDERYALKHDDIYYPAVTGKAPEISGGMYYIQDPKYMFDFFDAGYEDMNNQLEREDISNAERDELTNKIAWLEDAMGNLEEVIAGRDYGTLGDGVVGVDGKFYRAELNENSYENENGEWVTDHYFTLADDVVLFELDQEGISAFESYEFELLREDRDEGINHPMPYRRLSGIDGINLHISTDVKFSGNLGSLVIIYPEDSENRYDVKFVDGAYMAGTGTRNEETGEWDIEPEWVNVIDWDSYPDGELVESDEWWGTYQIITKRDEKIAIPDLELADNGVKISWDAVDGAATYRIFRKAEDENTFSGLTKTTKTSYTDTTVEDGKTYYYYVRCINENGKYFGAFVEEGVSIEIPAVIRAEVELELTDNGVKVSWGAVDGAASYRIFRKSEDEQTFGGLKKLTATSFNDTTVEKGKTYYYYVRCIDSNGKYIGEYDIVEIEVPGVIRTDISLELVAKGVSITWNEVKGVASYRIFRQADGETTVTGIKKLTATSFVDTTVEKGKTYIYYVRCINDAGKYVGEYDVEEIAIPGETKAVIRLENVSNGVKISWDAVTTEDVTSYRIFRQAEGETTATGIKKLTETSFTDKTVEAGKTYTYYVRCINSAGKYVGTYDVEEIAVPEKEGTVILTRVSNGVKVSWGAVDGAASYRIFRKAEGETTFTGLKKTIDTTFTDKTVENGKTYYYYVRCINESGKYFGTFDENGTPIDVN